MDSVSEVLMDAAKTPDELDDLPLTTDLALYLRESGVLG